MLADAQNGQLSRYFDTRDPVVIDVGAGGGSTELMEARTDVEPNNSGDLDIRRRKLQLRRKMMDAGLTPRELAIREVREQTADIVTRKARLSVAMRQPDEARSIGRGEPWDTAWLAAHQ